MSTRPTDNWSLGDSKDWLRARIDDGERCPCCTQFAKVYVRRLHRGMAKALIHMYRNRDANDMFDITKHLDTNLGDTSKLRYWELIDRADDDPAGVWTVTYKGKQFVRGLITVPSHVKVYDGRFRGLTGNQITIQQALGKGFSYDELMGYSGATRRLRMVGDE